MRARALRAPVTLLDEPLTGLDRPERARLLDELPYMLSRFAATSLLVTHDREEAFRLADYLVVLVEGRVHAAGGKSEVLRKPPDASVAELLGFTVLPHTGHLVAIPPGEVRLGCGPLQFTLLVERIADLGHHRHVIGTVAGRRVDVRLRVGDLEVALGTSVVIHAESVVFLSS